MNVLEVKNLCKRFGSRQILKNVSFHVEAGEIVGLLGPNGAGKTTAIRCILGLLSIDTGTVMINGIDVVKDFEEAVRSVGGIVESPELYSYMSGYDNLKMYARLYDGVTDEDIKRVVSYVKLDNRINDKIKKYSLGMRQRIGVAQAILHSPKLLVLDEPTNGLDPAGVKQLRDTLRMLADRGVGVLVSSHQLAEMELMCDRVVIIENGIINAEKSINELVEVKEDEHLTYRYRPDNLEEAAKLFEEAEIQSFIDGDELVAKLTASEAAEQLRILVNSNINIYSMYAEKRTLEEAFLKITEQGIIR